MKKQKRRLKKLQKLNSPYETLDGSVLNRFGSGFLYKLACYSWCQSKPNLNAFIRYRIDVTLYIKFCFEKKTFKIWNSVEKRSSEISITIAEI